MVRESVIGRKFSRWTVIEAIGDSPLFVKAACDCGTTRQVNVYSIVKGSSRSCGCLQKEVVSKLSFRHGQTTKNSRVYRAWSAMCTRGSNPRIAQAKDYIHRGVTVCDEWRGSGGFERFISHIGMPPTSKHSVDRIDVNKGYCPGNVRWATVKEQSRNRTDNHLITYKGKAQCVTSWAEELGVRPAMLLSRLNAYGWSVERALETPPTRRRAT